MNAPEAVMGLLGRLGYAWPMLSRGMSHAGQSTRNVVIRSLRTAEHGMLFPVGVLRAISANAGDATLNEHHESPFFAVTEVCSIPDSFMAASLNSEVCGFPISPAVVVIH